MYGDGGAVVLLSFAQFSVRGALRFGTSSSAMKPPTLVGWMRAGQQVWLGPGDGLGRSALRSAPGGGHAALQQAHGGVDR